MNADYLRHRLFKNFDFEELALELFRYQVSSVRVYRDFVQLLGIDIRNVHSLHQIPFLPVDLFKSSAVIADGYSPQVIFTSSGTTRQLTAQHAVADLALYEESFRRCFELFYGDIRDWCVLALLPSYLEREGSSLVYMVRDLIQQSNQPESGFFLHNRSDLSTMLEKLEKQKRKILLIGVTYALLDLAEEFPQPLSNTIILETGGMKGRRKEMVREEVHMILQQAFHVPTIHSEYGMTELLSQAYSSGNGLFHCPPWMQIRLREMNDPFTEAGTGKTGGINIIDFANLYSCSFLATSDLGKVHVDGTFEIVGRFDNSDIRGCNLLVD